MTPTPEPATFRELIEWSLKSMGVIHPLDTIPKSIKERPPAVVVERLDIIQRWMEAMVRAETARRLDEFADRITRDYLGEPAVATALHEHAEELRTGADA